MRILSKVVCTGMLVQEVYPSTSGILISLGTVSKLSLNASIVNVKYGLETYYTNLLCCQRGYVHSEIKEKAEIECKTLEHQTRFCLRLRVYMFMFLHDINVWYHIFRKCPTKNIEHATDIPSFYPPSVNIIPWPFPLNISFVVYLFTYRAGLGTYFHLNQI